MTEYTRKVTVIDPEGLHIRHSDEIVQFVNSVSRNGLRILLQKEGGEKVKPTRIVDVLSLGAHQGMSLTIWIEDPNEFFFEDGHEYIFTELTKLITQVNKPLD